MGCHRSNVSSCKISRPSLYSCRPIDISDSPDWRREVARLRRWWNRISRDKEYWPIWCIVELWDRSRLDTLANRILCNRRWGLNSIFHRRLAFEERENRSRSKIKIISSLKGKKNEKNRSNRGLLHFRVRHCTPTPQLLEHLLHEAQPLQPPFLGLFSITPKSKFFLFVDTHRPFMHHWNKYSDNSLFLTFVQ